MGDRVHLFGIRHHGPGSARSLLAALDELRPVEVLVELPMDVEPALEFASKPGMVPPVALLIHDAKDVKRAAFYPFVEYSPEWQAMRWAHRHGVDVHAIDLPYGSSLKLEDDAATASDASENASEDDGEDDSEDASQEDDSPDQADEVDVAVNAEPLDAMAALAGHSDGEAWWDALVERGAHGSEVFAAVAMLMGAAREDLEVDLDRASSGGDAERGAQRESRRESQREAHMRTQIREALKRTEGPVAVVVGAWHVPALENQVSAASDRARLKGTRPRRTAVTWVPWSDERMSFQAGYRAGVESPGWYRHLWETQLSQGAGSGTALWMARVARALREKGLPGAPSSSVDAARLATSLAALRGHAIPGLAEMQDAALGTLCHGEPTALSVVTRQLVVGERLGAVDEEVPLMPLASDLQRRQRAVRLKPESLERELALDLRTEGGLARSTLLHQLRLIDVPWGTLREARRTRGTFRELWTLRWEPELSLALADALPFGNSIEEAASRAAQTRAKESSRIGAVAEVVQDCLLADLEGAARAAIVRLQGLASHTSDLAALMEAAPPLAEVLRYGTARKLPEAELLALVEALGVQVSAGLAYAARALSQEAATTMANAARSFTRALELLGLEVTLAGWWEALRRVVLDADGAPLVAGTAARLLSDSGTYTTEETAARLSRALSSAVPAVSAAAWVEGFLAGDAAILMHDADLLRVLDAWLVGLDEEAVVPLLPVLRRCFASVGAVERRRLLRSLGTAFKGGSLQATLAPSVSLETLPAYAAGLPLMYKILGLDSGASQESEGAIE